VVMEPTSARKLDPATIASRAEAARAVAALTHGDLVRISNFARLRANGLSSIEWRDLLQEAFERIVSGSRRWRRDVGFVPFVCQTIRSLASEERRREAQQVTAGRGARGDGDDINRVVDAAPDVERKAIADEELEKILSGFEKDGDVLALIDGLAAGETAKETQQRASISSQAYDAARKRLRRFVAQKLAEDGEIL
jgi:DNA-directed RNA polymerase specialized sigma24 family protein